jgi:hypothetical protein
LNPTIVLAAFVFSKRSFFAPVILKVMIAPLIFQVP